MEVARLTLAPCPRSRRDGVDASIWFGVGLLMRRRTLSSCGRRMHHAWLPVVRNAARFLAAVDIGDAFRDALRPDTSGAIAAFSTGSGTWRLWPPSVWSPPPGSFAGRVLNRGNTQRRSVLRLVTQFYNGFSSTCLYGASSWSATSWIQERLAFQQTEMHVQRAASKAHSTPLRRQIEHTFFSIH